MGTLTTGQRTRNLNKSPAGASAHQPGVARPLHSESSESPILGCALLDNSLMRGPIADLSVDDFSPGANRELYRLMLNCSWDGVPFDEYTLAEELERKGELAQVCDYATIGGTMEGAVVDPGRVGQHVRVILDYSEFRRILSICESVLKSFDEGVPLAEITSDFYKTVQYLLSGRDLQGNLLPDTERDRTRAALSAREITLKAL